MSYRVMVIDDDRTRSGRYQELFSSDQFEPIFVWTKKEFDQHRDTPIDAYFIDVFLDGSEWGDINAAHLLTTEMPQVPLPAPVFLISSKWYDDQILDVLKQAGESSTKVVQYLAWSEIENATDSTKQKDNRLHHKLITKILFEMARWHGRNIYHPGPEDTIKILLLSDVQFGDPKTDPKATFSEHWIAHALKKHDSLPDLIVIAGDVSHSGRPDQFALAEERLTQDLIGPIWGNNNIDRMRDRIILVPGNHDVNLRFSACDSKEFNLEDKSLVPETNPTVDVGPGDYLSHHDYSLEPFRRFGRQLTGDSGWGRTQSFSWVDRRFLHWGIRFFTLNSVAKLNAGSPRHASFEESELREINRSTSGVSDYVYSIAVSHHGLRPVGSSDIEIDNWSDLARDTFAMHDIRLWLYGHYHAFEARSLNSMPFDDNPLWLVQLPTPRIGHSTRGFCLLELTRNAGKVTDAHVDHYVLENSTVTKKKRNRVFEKG